MSLDNKKSYVAEFTCDTDVLQIPFLSSAKTVKDLYDDAAQALLDSSDRDEPVLCAILDVAHVKIKEVEWHK